MKIVTEHGEKQPSPPKLGRTAAKHDIYQAAGTKTRGAYALDISGKVMDNTAYEGQGKTAEDVMQEAGLTDVALQKNYMAVMSNSMSDEDFAKLQEEGFHPGSTEIETVVTIVDQIKASMARGGGNVAGYTDDIDMEALESIMGSKGLAAQVAKQFQENDVPPTKENIKQTAAALERAQAAGETVLSEGAVKYMVNNQMEPTIDNIYRAQHSSKQDAGKQGKGYYRESESGYYAKKAEEIHWDKLQTQMESVIEDTGLSLNHETMEEAKWLVEKGIPLTTDSLKALHDIRESKLPCDTKQVIAAVASALSNGSQAGKANLADERSYVKRAASLQEEFVSFTEEAVDLAASKGKAVNFYRLREAQTNLNQGSETAPVNTDVANRRMLEEIRLKMTIEAGIRLQRKGFSIETAELSDLVEALREEEAAVWQTLLQEEGDTADKARLYQDTIKTVENIPHLPAAVIGKFAWLGDHAGEFTLLAVQEAGMVQKNAYDKAGETYEALMTAPRADLGDSIKKAFRNIDSILDDLQLERNEVNAKAVRILGYNNMEINEKSILAVKEAELTVRQAVSSLTPGRVLQMIRDGVNPLSLNMEELNQYLADAQTTEEDFDKYSRFLYKLEQEQAISPEERTAYIGTYRLLRQLEKSDGAAIGALINTGAELSFKNLLTAIRSSNKRGLDVRIDDVSEITQKVWQGNSITDQIGEAFEKSRKEGSESTYYHKLEHEIYTQFDKSILPPEFLMSDPSLEAMAQMQKELENTQKYKDEGATQMRDALSSEESVIKMLLEFDQPVTTNNLAAAGLLQSARGKLSQRLKQLSEEAEVTEEFEDAVSRLQEGLSDEVSAKEAYENMEQTFSGILEKIVYEGTENTRIDMREIGSLFKQIRLTGSLAREENYEVPVKINGEYTSINLRIVHQGKENGKVDVTMESEILGKAAASFRLKTTQEEGVSLTGYIACANTEGLNFLENRRETFLKELTQAGIKTKNLPFVASNETNSIHFYRGGEAERTETEADKNISTKKLYEVAKIFISIIK